MHKKPYVELSPFPQSWSKVRLELQCLACIAPEGGREREVGGEFLLLCALGVSCLEDVWAGWFSGLTWQCCIGQQLRRPQKYSGEVFLCKAHMVPE